ncbi:hypothetical protein KC19_3G266700 [Ceratodon purpureus]|uniref:Uncharacterized protein n=1 Tax=Ceratodon purpureus TaxID=3225 RepID=A0A8T0IPT9_CERPU|nr:hypothetical protein KC19_3G266700 [Ceratodon purpureus]
MTEIVKKDLIRFFDNHLQVPPSSLRPFDNTEPLQLTEMVMYCTIFVPNNVFNSLLRCTSIILHNTLHLYWQNGRLKIRRLGFLWGTHLNCT